MIIRCTRREFITLHERLEHCINVHEQNKVMMEWIEELGLDPVDYIMNKAEIRVVDLR